MATRNPPDGTGTDVCIDPAFLEARPDAERAALGGGTRAPTPRPRRVETHLTIPPRL